MTSGPIGPEKKRVIPDNEAQARALVHLVERPEELRRVWQIAVDTAPVRERDGSPILSERHIKEVLGRLGLASAEAEPAGGPATAWPPVEAIYQALAAGAYDGDLDGLGTAVEARRRAIEDEGEAPCPMP